MKNEVSSSLLGWCQNKSKSKKLELTNSSPQKLPESLLHQQELCLLHSLAEAAAYY